MNINKNLLISITLLIGFSSMAVFGFLAMGTFSDIHGHGTCIASLVNSASCVLEMNIINFSSFHIDAFLSFTSAIFNTLSAILLLLLPIYFFSRINSLDDENGYYTSLNDIFGSSVLSLLTFRNWLSLRYNSPNFAYIIR